MSVSIYFGGRRTYMAEKQYSCPVCGYNSDNEEDVKNHMAEMADDPKHQEYDLKQQEEEQEKSRKKE